MVPTLFGRIQTRIAVLAVIGGLVTLVVTPFLPGDGALSSRYRATFVVLVSVAVVGIGWELLYHFLQQFRWEKDWPTPFGLVTGLNEGVLIWVLLDHGWLPTGSDVPLRAFVILFSCVWVATWLWVNGPMRVVSVHWRFNGGRLV